MFDLLYFYINDSFKTKKDSKKDLLFKTLKENKKSKNDKILIFVQQKRVADFLASNVSEMLASMEVAIKCVKKHMLNFTAFLRLKEIPK